MLRSERRTQIRATALVVAVITTVLVVTPGPAHTAHVGLGLSTCGARNPRS